ncbi:MAG: HEAT repeat domain-containing protein [Candidatus Riflebacteria bacterium]|mgnify:CR=1 FL=1|nr:HEAT repeat domain-containing protein [Candidatus Riflebacteria bacterium]
MKKNKLKLDPKNKELLAKALKDAEKLNKKSARTFITNFIDLGGYSVAVLLDSLHLMPSHMRKYALENLSYFFLYGGSHTKKLLKRLIIAIKRSKPYYRPQVLAMLADLLFRSQFECSDKRALRIANSLSSEIESQFRKSTKLSQAAAPLAFAYRAELEFLLPHMLKALNNSLSQESSFSEYLFIEDAITGIQNIGGKELLKFLANPTSKQALVHLKMAWRNRDPDLLKKILRIAKQLSEDFPKALVSFASQSEMAVSFYPFLTEAAESEEPEVASMAKKALQKDMESNFSMLASCLNEESPEARIVAINSMSGFPKELSGELLTAVAGNIKEPFSVRVAAIEALYYQKNANAIEKILTLPEIPPQIKSRAKVYHAMAKPRKSAIKTLTKYYLNSPKNEADDLEFYLSTYSARSDLPYLNKLAETLPIQNKSRIEKIISSAKGRNK